MDEIYCLEQGKGDITPDYTIKDATYVEEKSKNSEGEKKNTSLKHSRSFKYSTHSKDDFSVYRRNIVVSTLDLVNSSNGSHGPSSPVPEDCKISEKMDSAYGTDSNRTASRNTESSHTFPVAEKSPAGSYNIVHNHSGSPLPAQDESGLALQPQTLEATLQQKNSRSSMPQERSASSLQQERSGSSLQQDRSGSSLQQEKSGSSLQQDRSGSSLLPQDRSGSSLQQDRSGSSLHNQSSSSAAFNNETYMSIESNSPADQSYMSLSTPLQATGGDENPNNTYQSVHPMSDTSVRSEPNTSQGSRITVIDKSVSTPKRPQQDLLKRSPVLRDVTAGFTPIPPPPPSADRTDKRQKVEEEVSGDKGKDKLHAPLTIIIPNISNQAVTKANSTSPDKWSDKTIPLDILNPGTHSRDLSSFSSHDYENLALVNINRAPLGVQHWRTYSDMANSKHDESTKYERNKLNFTSSSDYRYFVNQTRGFLCCKLFTVNLIIFSPSLREKKIMLGVKMKRLL